MLKLSFNDLYKEKTIKTLIRIVLRLSQSSASIDYRIKRLTTLIIELSKDI